MSREAANNLAAWLIGCKESGRTKQQVTPEHWQIITRVYAAAHNAGQLPQKYRGIKVTQTAEQRERGVYTANGVEVRR